MHYFISASTKYVKLLMEKTDALNKIAEYIIVTYETEWPKLNPLEQVMQSSNLISK